MDRIISIIILLLIALVSFAISTCISNIEFNGIHNSRKNLNWEGVYTNKILSVEGHYLDVRISLKPDQSFEYYYERMDEAFDPFYWKGSFRWDRTGNIIMADMPDVHHQYRVEKNKLIRLDMENFVLVKTQ